MSDIDRQLQKAFCMGGRSAVILVPTVIGTQTLRMLTESFAEMGDLLTEHQPFETLVELHEEVQDRFYAKQRGNLP